MKQYRVIQTNMNRYYLQHRGPEHMDWVFLKHFFYENDALNAYADAIKDRDIVEDMKTIKKVLISTEVTT